MSITLRNLLARIAAVRAVLAAEAARRDRRWLDSAALYERAVRLRPDVAGFHIQAGHMRKEGGDYAAAEQHYEAAARLLPDNAELTLQFGHFYSVTGRLVEAAAAYARAADLRPGWEDPQREFARLRSVTAGFAAAGEIADDGRMLTPSDVLRQSIERRILPEYLPSGGVRSLPEAGVWITRLGRFDRSAWGTPRTLQGIEAIMGHCYSVDPVDEVRLVLNGLIVRRLTPQACDAQDREAGKPLRKFVFNLWIDLSDFACGRYHAEIAFHAIGDTHEQTAARAFRDYVTIVPPTAAPRLPGSETWVPPVDPNDLRGLDEQIDARPSVVRQALARLIEPPRSILVLRTDQLGDLSISVPAIRRLRGLAPDARIVGLLTTANADLARSLGLFDEVIVADFPDIPAERQRVMIAAEQERLRAALHAHAFDLAVDLAPAHVSRALLLLSGAKLTAGFGRVGAPWLDAAFDFDVEDERGHTSILPSAAKTLALVEALGTLFVDTVPNEPLPPDGGALLSRFGIAPGERFVLLHDGARVAFSRWPGYPDLARALLDRHGFKVVLLSDDAGLRAALPDKLLADPRFALIDERLAFEELDALAAHCALFVGNDTGPKHLAALRGVPVVSVHSARTNWGEWGQAGRGAIITRQMPCAACHIYNEPEECARGFTCITNIKVDEVLTVAESFLNDAGPAPKGPAPAALLPGRGQVGSVHAVTGLRTTSK